MAIESSMFGPLILTGDDAKAFRRLVRYSRGNKAARAAIARGEQMSDEFDRNGFVEIILRERKPAMLRARKKAK